MLKKKFFIYSIVVLGLCGCNSIDDNKRFIDYEPPTSDRNVLLEEFTGQECINCPKGAAEAKRLQETYNHKVIVIGIHAGTYARGSQFNTKAGNAYWAKFYPNGDQVGYPAAIVNRNGKVSAGYQQEWSALVSQAFQVPTYVSLELKADCSVDSVLTVTSTLKKTISQLENKTKFLLLLTESKIIDYQKSENTYIDEYEHNHVLRGAIGDKDEKPNYWGTDVDITQVEEIEVVSEPYKLDEDWKPENMNVVGIVYDVDTYEVLQVEEVSIKENNN